MVNAHTLLSVQETSGNMGAVAGMPCCNDRKPKHSAEVISVAVINARAHGLIYELALLNYVGLDLAGSTFLVSV